MKPVFNWWKPSIPLMQPEGFDLSVFFIQIRGKPIQALRVKAAKTQRSEKQPRRVGDG